MDGSEKTMKEMVFEELRFMFSDEEYGFEVFVTMKEGEAIKHFILESNPWSPKNSFKHKVQREIRKALEEKFLDEGCEYDKVQNIVTYSDGLVADAGNRLVTENGRLLRDGNDMLFPAIWRSDRKELIAYSESGYNRREWTLPDDWAGVSMVKHSFFVYTVVMPGLDRASQRKGTQNKESISILAII